MAHIIFWVHIPTLKSRTMANIKLSIPILTTFLLFLLSFQMIPADPVFDMRFINLGTNLSCTETFTKVYKICVKPLPKDEDKALFEKDHDKRKCERFFRLNNCIQERFPPLIHREECQTANATQLLEFCKKFKKDYESMNCDNSSFGIEAKFSLIVAIILVGQLAI